MNRVNRSRRFMLLCAAIVVIAIGASTIPQVRVALADITTIAGVRYSSVSTEPDTSSATEVAPDDTTTVSSAQSTYGFDLPSSIPSGFSQDTYARITTFGTNDVIITVTWSNSTTGEKIRLTVHRYFADTDDLVIGSTGLSSTTINGHTAGVLTGIWNGSGWQSDSTHTVGNLGSRVAVMWRQGSGSTAVRYELWCLGNSDGSNLARLKNMAASMSYFQ